MGSDEAFAFCLTLGAGLATTIGAAMAFCIDQNNNFIFASCLSVAAGVMVYVSFVEIFFKSRDEYQAYELEEHDANMAATLTFFLGLGMSIAMEVGTNALFNKKIQEQETRSDAPAKESKNVAGEEFPADHEPKPEDFVEIDGSKGAQALPDIERGASPSDNADKKEAAAYNLESDKKAAQKASLTGTPGSMSMQERLAMLQMAAFSGVAIAAHNFPEGLATFVAAVEDPEFGASMAIAIAIHNIPEGLAVAIPILKATNSKGKAFFWAFLSGLAEPVGAGLAWLALREVIGPLTYAMLFGVIGGVMVHISIRKLLPTALKYDPDNKVTSYAFFAGMLVMAASLVAFGY